jgi:hypothetical protein
VHGIIHRLSIIASDFNHLTADMRKIASCVHISLLLFGGLKIRQLLSAQL